MAEEIKEADQLSSEKLSQLVVEGMLEKKAEDVVVLDLREISNAIADFFVLCSGNSDTQVEAISDSVDEIVLKEGSISPWHTEGTQNKEWVLMDYVDVVAHVFKKEKREFYALESLWGDAKVLEVSV